MANLIISNQCNLQCAYCFASDFLHSESTEKDSTFISETDFKTRLDFLERSGIEDVRLIGGEPGLHPSFGDLIQQAERHFSKIVVFTNGILNEDTLMALEALSPEHLTVMVNMSSSHASGKLKTHDYALRAQALRRLGERVIMGFTIVEADFNYDHLLFQINDYGSHKSLRIGLAQPALMGKNAYLHPKQYPAVGHRLASFAVRAANHGIRLEFDCGFVRCMFTQSDLAQLTEANVYTEWRCNPVLDIDILGGVSHCFPLAGRFKTTLGMKTQASELRLFFTEQIKPFRVAGIYKECSSCKFKLNQECTGGCIAATLLRFHPASIRMGGVAWNSL